ncbi:MAG: hypothetical protein U0165_16025 [Polyangiaceae bacterium]
MTYAIFRGAEKPRESQIGAEAEKIGLFVATGSPLHCEPDGRPSLSWLLARLVEQKGWEAEPESPGGPVIALRRTVPR